MPAPTALTPRRFRESRPTTKLAFALAAVSACAVLVDIFSNRLDAWAPNVATEAFFVGLAVVVIDRIVKDEERRRLRPRLDRARSQLRLEFHELLDSVAFDYVETHRSSWPQIPLDSVTLLSHWVEGLRTTDAARNRGPDGRPFILTRAESFARTLHVLRQMERDLLEPELVAAMDSLCETVARSDVFFGHHYWAGSGEDRRDNDEGAVSLVAEGVLEFATVLVRNDATLLPIPRHTLHRITSFIARETTASSS